MSLAALGYASGNFAKSLQNTTVGLIYLYFLVDVLGMSAPLAGMILLISQLWDCIIDPILGHAIDQRCGSSRAYNKIILYALPLSALSFIGIFWLPISAGDGTAWWVAGSCIVFRLAYAIVDVPHNAFLAAFSTDSRKRSELAALRFLFSSVGSLSVFAFAAPALAQQQDPDRFVSFAVLLAILYCVVMGASVLLTPAAAPTSTVAQNLNLSKALASLLSNRRLMRILLVSVISAALLTMFSRMTAFYAKSWLDDAELASWLLGAHFIGQIVSAPAWSHLGVRLEKKTAARAAHVLMGVVAVGFLVTAPTTSFMAMFFYFWAGVALSGFTIMNWALVPDCVEYTQAQSGARHEAVTFGVLTSLNKVSSGLGMALIGWALHFSGYDGQSGAGDRSFELLLAMTLPAAAGALVCILLLGALSMSHAEHAALKGT